jgi:hypothetical protein
MCRPRCLPAAADTPAATSLTSVVSNMQEGQASLTLCPLHAEGGYDEERRDGCKAQGHARPQRGQNLGPLHRQPGLQLSHATSRHIGRHHNAAVRGSGQGGSPTHMYGTHHCRLPSTSAGRRTGIPPQRLQTAAATTAATDAGDGSHVCTTHNSRWMSVKWGT